MAAIWTPNHETTELDKQAKPARRSPLLDFKMMNSRNQCKTVQTNKLAEWEAVWSSS